MNSKTNEIEQTNESEIHNKILSYDKENCQSSETDSFNKSNCSYIYDSMEENEILESNSIDEKEYFGDENLISNSEESSVVWIDSEDGCLSNGELLNDASWLLNKPFKKIIKKVSEKIKFKINKNVLSTKYKIKIIKISKEFIVLVDNYNIVYFIKDQKIINAYKIDYFQISDIILLNNSVLLSSNKSLYLKILDFNGKIIDVNKKINNVIKMYLKNNNLYIIGDNLYRLDKNLNVLNVFNYKFIDLCVSDDNLLCLDEKGDLFEFKENLIFIKKISFKNKFEFKRLWCNNFFYFIGQERGLTIIKKNDMSFIKEINNLKEPPTDLNFNNDFIIYGSNYDNSLRILKNNLILYDKFPFSKTKIKGFKCLGIYDNIFYICNSNFITLFKINYITVTK